MHTNRKLAALLAFTGTLAGTAHAHGPIPRPWQISPLSTMSACQAGTETDAISPYCKTLLENFARELEACQTALAESSPDATTADASTCQGQAAATAAAKVLY